MSIENDVLNRIDEISLQELALQQKKLENAVDDAKKVFRYIYKDIVDKIAKTKMKTVSGSLVGGDAAFYDELCHEEKIFISYFSHTSEYCRKDSFWGIKRWKTHRISLARPRVEFNAFFCELFRLLQLEEITARMYIDNAWDSRQKIDFDPLTFSGYEYKEKISSLFPADVRISFWMQYSYTQR